MFTLFSLFLTGRPITKATNRTKLTKKTDMTRFSALFLALFLLFGPVVEVRGQAEGPQKGGVGLVLSGGGAKGLYHIGVIEALEERGVPIDYVAGTSMGSIIAAMYASGYSPAEMRQIVLSGQIQEWVSGRIDPSKYKPYYRQLGNSPSFINLWLDLSDEDKKFRMPSSLISSTQVDMALLQLFTPASTAADGDFSQLMVPFLCVAADMNRREPVTLVSGSLTEAVRASMAIPLAFKPVKSGERLFYDGGVYDNFPWRPLDERYAPSLLIGSICTSGNVVPKEGDSLIDQALLIAMGGTDYTLPEGRSVTIHRAIEAGMLDFAEGASIMDAGYEDTIQQIDQILAQVGQTLPAEYYAKRREAFRQKCPPLIFDNYELHGATEEQTAYIRDYMRVDYQTFDGQRQMSFDRLRDLMYALMTGSDYTMDIPEAHYNPETERYTFKANLRARPNFKLTIGGNISSTAFNQFYIGLNYQTFGRTANRFSADLYLGPTYTWGTIGGRVDFFWSDPFFLTYGYNFSTKNFRHGSFGRIARVDNTLPIKSSDSYGQLGLGVRLNHRSVFDIKLHGGHTNYHYYPDIADLDHSDHTRFFFLGAKAEVARNTLDKYLYPTRGSDLRLSAIYISGSERFRAASAKNFSSGDNRNWWGARFSWTKVFDMPSLSWFSLGLNAESVYTNHPDFRVPGASMLSKPSYEPIPHAKMIFMPDFYADRFVAGGVQPTFDLMPNFFLRTGFYAMYRNKNHYASGTLVDWKDRQMHYIAECSLVYHTPIGPVNLSFIKYDLKSWRNAYLMFNFGYPIFAPKGTFY